MMDQIPNQNLCAMTVNFHSYMGTSAVLVIYIETKRPLFS